MGVRARLWRASLRSPLWPTGARSVAGLRPLATPVFSSVFLHFSRGSCPPGCGASGLRAETSGLRPAPCSELWCECPGATRASAHLGHVRGASASSRPADPRTPSCRVSPHASSQCLVRSWGGLGWACALSAGGRWSVTRSGDARRKTLGVLGSSFPRAPRAWSPPPGTLLLSASSWKPARGLRLEPCPLRTDAPLGPVPAVPSRGRPRPGGGVSLL